jgi:aminoglycoside 3-N-acetyltransferase
MRAVAEPDPEAALPCTRDSLAADLLALGVRPGSTLLVHSSMRAVGWVVGGAQALALALFDALGPEGTLVVPTHTPDNSDPSAWQHPPVPAHWWPVIREQTPAFDPAVTPSRWMGALAEIVRTWPGVRRSDHPQVSFAAVGPHAERIVADHALDEMLGERSPLGRLYDSDADVLLLGAGHDSNTSLHLAEYRRPSPPRKREGAAVRTPDGGRRWVWWEDVALDEDDFGALGEALDATGAVRRGKVGAADCRLVRMRVAVDFAVGWFAVHRG